MNAICGRTAHIVMTPNDSLLSTRLCPSVKLSLVVKTPYPHPCT